MQDKDMSDKFSVTDDLDKSSEFRRGAAEGLIVQAKQANFESSTEGDYQTSQYKDFLQRTQLPKSKYTEYSALHSHPNGEVLSMNIEDPNLCSNKTSNEGSRISRSSLSEADISEIDNVPFKNKYKHTHQLTSDDSELSVSTPVKNEKLSSMKVTFNRQKTDKYLSQDRNRAKKKKKGELDLVPSKNASTGYNTAARNSQRVNQTINTSDIISKKIKHKSYTNTVSTNVSHRRRTRRKSSNNSNGKSRNKHKSLKTKKRMMIETTKSHALSKLIPKQAVWTKANVTPIASDYLPVKLEYKTDTLPTESDLKMMRKLHSLKYELQK